MDSSKTLLLIPGIIYGVGLVSLLNAFRAKIYWEIAVMAVLMFFTLILNWFLFSQQLDTVAHKLGIYTLLMVSPLLFTRACNMLVPSEAQLDTKAHYFDIRRNFYLLLAGHTSVNILIQFLVFDDGLNGFRFIGVAVLFTCAIYNKIWLRIVMMAMFYLIFAYIFITTGKYLIPQV